MKTLEEVKTRMIEEGATHYMGVTDKYWYFYRQREDGWWERAIIQYLRRATAWAMIGEWDQTGSKILSAALPPRPIKLFKTDENVAHTR